MRDYIGLNIVEAGLEQKDYQDGYMVVYDDGHKTWYPKDVFEKHYSTVGMMPFGFALQAIREGKKVTRHDWNRPKQYVFITDHIEVYTHVGYQNINNEDKETDVFPTLVLKNTNNKFRVGWLPNLDDLIHDDWYIVE
jgi:hypothetical protein